MPTAYYGPLDISMDIGEFGLFGVTLDNRRYHCHFTIRGFEYSNVGPFHFVKGERRIGCFVVALLRNNQNGEMINLLDEVEADLVRLEPTRENIETLLQFNAQKIKNHFDNSFLHPILQIELTRVAMDYYISLYKDSFTVSYIEERKRLCISYYDRLRKEIEELTNDTKAFVDCFLSGADYDQYLDSIFQSEQGGRKIQFLMNNRSIAPDMQAKKKKAYWFPYQINTLRDLIAFDISNILTRDHFPILQCPICKDYFIGAKEGTIYCDEICPEDRGKEKSKPRTCKEFGAQEAHRRKIEQDKLLKLANTIANKLYQAYCGKRKKPLGKEVIRVRQAQYNNFIEQFNKKKKELEQRVLTFDQVWEWLIEQQKSPPYQSKRTPKGDQ